MLLGSPTASTASSSCCAGSRTTFSPSSPSHPDPIPVSLSPLSLFPSFPQVLLGTPHRIQYLVRLLRWKQEDVFSLRSAFSRAGPFIPKPEEAKHLAIAISFLLANCVFQFILFGVMVGVNPNSRPPALVAILVVIALGSVVTAGIYTAVSPLSWPLDDTPESSSSDADLSVSDASHGPNHSSSTQQLMSAEQQHGHPAGTSNGLIGTSAGSAIHRKIIAMEDGDTESQDRWAGLVPLQGSDRYELQSKLARKQPMWRPNTSDSRHTISQGDSLVRPGWSGGLFSCCEDPDVAMAVTFCCCCAHGFNLHRVGFGDGIVHTAVMILGIVSPVTIFTVSARFISSESSAIKLTLIVFGCCGTVCIGLLYLGYWRWRLRRTFGLPPSHWACGHKSTADLLTSVLFPLCAMCQEVRTAKRHGLELVPMKMEPPMPMAKPPAKAKGGWWGGEEEHHLDEIREGAHYEGQNGRLEPVEEVDEMIVEPYSIKVAVEKALSAPRVSSMNIG